MKSSLKYILAVALFCAAAFSTVKASVVYSDSGSGSSGTTYISDVSGQFQVDYYTSEWSAYYDDVGFAYFSYTLYSASGRYDVTAFFGGPPPVTGWNFFSYYTDLFAGGHPDFLDPFWLVAP